MGIPPSFPGDYRPGTALRAARPPALLHPYGRTQHRERAADVRVGVVQGCVCVCLSEEKERVVWADCGRSGWGVAAKRRRR